jgi:hypothetical protein
MKYLLFPLLLFASAKHYSQTELLPEIKRPAKHNYYLMWGYNREAYTTSTIHFQNKGNLNDINEYGPYDFIIEDAKAHDKPDFDQLGDVVNITIPQYSFRIGMWLNNKNDEGFELNYDHAKYVVTEGQTVRIRGTINGIAVDKDSVLENKYFHFEHTDGANFWQIDYMKRTKIYYSKNNFFRLSYVLKPGMGLVIPRTDATIFGHRLNNNWKVAGITASLEMALRAEIHKHFIVEFAGKSGWANYINCFVLGRGNGKASHKFGYVEGILSLGYQF